MCDYSLQAIKSRPATVGDKLVVTNFGMGTYGFADTVGINDPDVPVMAVCVLPGTELAFASPVSVRLPILMGSVSAPGIDHQVARFR